MGEVKLRRLLLVAALATLACKHIDRIITDPSRICPPNHVLTAEGCVERPSAVVPAPSPEPLPTATPAPTPVNPGPLPTPTVVPEPTATPAPTASPTPAPAPKPTPDPCIRQAADVLAYQLRQGHVTKRTESLWCNEDGHDGPICHDPATGDRIDPETRAVLTPGWRWWGTCEPGTTPEPIATPTPVARPTPTPGAYSCGGVPAARIGISFNKAPNSKPGCTFDKTSLRVDGDCILVADASVRGPKGSDYAIPSTEAHLGWLPGCWYVVRPRWEQQHAPDLAVDIGVRHWLQSDPATSVASWDVTEPPYAGADFGSVARFQFDFSATVRLRACWPPDVSDAVCSDWYEVIHR